MYSSIGVEGFCFMQIAPGWIGPRSRWGGHDIFVRISKGFRVGNGAIGGWFWDLAAADSTSVDRQDDDFTYLDAIVGPQTVGFAEDVGLAVIFDSNSGKGVFGFHFVQVDQLISILVFYRRMVPFV